MNQTSLYELKDLANITGLNESFIRKCIKVLYSILKSHIKRGDNNRLLFESSCVIIFDQIKQHKEKGLSLNEIKRNLMPEKQTEQTNNKVYSNTLQSSINELNKNNEYGNIDASSYIINMTDKLLQSETSRIIAESEIKIQKANYEVEKYKEEVNHIKENMKSLPFKGQNELFQLAKEKFAQLELILNQIEEKTPFIKLLFFKNKELKRLWEQKHKILKEFKDLFSN